MKQNYYKYKDKRLLQLETTTLNSLVKDDNLGISEKINKIFIQYQFMSLFNKIYIIINI